MVHDDIGLQGFYTAYRGVFETIASEDNDYLDDKDWKAPEFGTSDSDYDEVCVLPTTELTGQTLFFVSEENKNANFFLTVCICPMGETLTTTHCILVPWSPANKRNEKERKRNLRLAFEMVVDFSGGAPVLLPNHHQKATNLHTLSRPFLLALHQKAFLWHAFQIVWCTCYTPTLPQ